MSEFAVNQFGQKLERGVIVGHTNKTGSWTDRKVGVITGFGIRREGYSRDTMVAKVTWVANNFGIQEFDDFVKSPGVDIAKLFALDPRNIDQDISRAVLDCL